jgi:hypothetical protein
VRNSDFIGSDAMVHALVAQCSPEFVYLVGQYLMQQGTRPMVWDVVADSTEEVSGDEDVENADA